MAYGDSGNNRGPLVILDLGTTFTNDKAYKISIQNNYKFRISTITPKINPDGSRAWDFKTGISGITISWRDMCRVHLAAQEMLKIYLRRHSGKWDKKVTQANFDLRLSYLLYTNQNVEESKEPMRVLK